MDRILLILMEGETAMEDDLKGRTPRGRHEQI
jgi:hypothetical protein